MNSRLHKNFGFAGPNHVISLGINAKMTEIAAAMGLTMLDDIDTLVAVNYRNYKQYQQELAEIPGVKLQAFDESENCNYQYLIVQIDQGETLMGRDQILEILWAENILARSYFSPGCHRSVPYSQDPLAPQPDLIHTEKVVNEIICLPTGTAINSEDIAKITQLIRFIVANGKTVTQQLKREFSSKNLYISKH